MYEFEITIRGDGDTPDEAWQNACMALAMDPGSTPDEHLELDDNDEPIIKMTVEKALRLIIANKQCPALNNCYNYARLAHVYLRDRQLADLRTQLLYVVNNMTNWRAGSTTTATKEQIKECRRVLKEACK